MSKKRLFVRPSRQFEQRLADVQQASNPLLAASKRLVRCLTEIPPRLDPTQVERLRELINEELVTFKLLAERVNLKREHVVAAHYAICTALDEEAFQHEWGQGWWASNSLLIEHHQDNQGGTKVFQVLGRLVNSPAENIAVIELIYQLMSLGFLGRYREMSDGDRQHREIRHRLYDLLLRHHGPVPDALSPHIAPASPGRFPRLLSISPWLTAAVLTLVLAAMFGWYKYQLLLSVHDLEQQIAAIGNLAPPPPPKTLRLTALLKEEIARGVVSVKEDTYQSAVTFQGDAMFSAGQTEVKKSLIPTLDKVAAEIGRVQGNVQVIGHSDNQPIRSARFASNQALSEERAAVVSEYLAAHGVSRGRLEAIGKGDREPLTDNKTPAARAANRRVEVVVSQ